MQICIIRFCKCLIYTIIYLIIIIIYKIFCDESDYYNSIVKLKCDFPEWHKNFLITMDI